MMYKLHTTDFTLPKNSEFEDIITDKTNVQQLRNKLAVVKPIGRDNYITRDNRELPEEAFEEEMVKIGTPPTGSSARASSLVISVICIAAIGVFLTAYAILKQCMPNKLQSVGSGYEQIA